MCTGITQIIGRLNSYQLRAHHGSLMKKVTKVQVEIIWKQSFLKNANQISGVIITQLNEHLLAVNCCKSFIAKVPQVSNFASEVASMHWVSETYLEPSRTFTIFGKTFSR